MQRNLPLTTETKPYKKPNKIGNMAANVINPLFSIPCPSATLYMLLVEKSGRMIGTGEEIDSFNRLGYVLTP